MLTNHLYLRLLVVIIMIAIASSCKYYVDHNFRQSYSEINKEIYNEISSSSFFKVHFKNGDVGVMNSWDLKPSGDTLFGKGSLYNYNRSLIKEGELSFDLEEIAIIETNELANLQSKDKNRMTAITILAAANLIGDAICLTNPKACFGSCPTFYLEENDNLHSTRAEGFSSSIAPVLERKDIDALQYVTRSREFHLRMKNEALETHVINEVFIEAVLKNVDEKVYADRYNNYYRCKGHLPPAMAKVANRDILDKVKAIDEKEYFSVTDSLDLFTREEIYLNFDSMPGQEKGLVLNFRQSLLTTFLLYSGISYMGDEFGQIFANIENNDKSRKYFSLPYDKLGGIKVYIKNPDKKWVFVEEIKETGPIAKNLNIIRLPSSENGQATEIKLELTKGLWRVDHVGLTTIIEKTEALKVAVTDIESINGETYTPDEIAHDDEAYLISLPGNEFRLKFELPEIPRTKEFELFLSTKGYYLEWIRKEWLEEKDIAKLRKMMTLDKKTWRELAIEFKSMEQEMETVFWNSKYTPTQ